MHVAQRTDHTFLDFNATCCSLERATRRTFDVARLADRRLNPQLELLGHRDLDLRIFPRRAEHTHAFDPSFRADDRELFLARELSRLRKVG